MVGPVFPEGRGHEVQLNATDRIPARTYIDHRELGDDAQNTSLPLPKVGFPLKGSLLGCRQRQDIKSPEWKLEPLLSPD